MSSNAWLQFASHVIENDTVSPVIAPGIITHFAVRLDQSIAQSLSDPPAFQTSILVLCFAPPSSEGGTVFGPLTSK